MAKWIFYNNEDIIYFNYWMVSSIFSRKVVQKTELSQCIQELLTKRISEIQLLSFVIMTEDNKEQEGQGEKSTRAKNNLKIPTFRLLVPSEVGRQLALVCLETRFEFLQNILTFLHFIRSLLHLYLEYGAGVQELACHGYEQIAGLLDQAR